MSLNLNSKCCLLAALALLGVTSCFAQAQNAWWFFGHNAGLHFTNAGTVAVSGSLSSIETASCLSYPDSTLRCYSDGSTVFNSNGIPIPGADSLAEWLGDLDTFDYGGTFTNGGLLLEGFDDSTVYELHLNKTDYTPLNWIKGIFLNKLIITPTTEKILLPKNQLIFQYDSAYFEALGAIRHANGRDWWIITHKTGNAQFIRFLLSPTGIEGPYFQTIGPDYLSNTGTFSFSPLGNKMIAGVELYGILDLYDFDRCTGLLSNKINLGDLPYAYSIYNGYYAACFSPDESRLYASSFQKLFQFDLQASNIKQSQTTIYTEPFFGNASPNDSSIALHQMQLGNNEKIYLAASKRTATDIPLTSYNHRIKYLSVINNPNALGMACNFTPYSFYLNGHYSLCSLPNLVNYNLGKLVASACDTICAPAVTQTQQETICNGDSALIYGVYQKVAGVYGDTLHTYNQCDSLYRSTTLTVEIVNTAVTENNKTLTATLSNANYQWYNCDSSINITGATAQTYTPTHTGNYACIVSNNGCSNMSACTEVITGIRELQILNSKLKIYPNPASSKFTLECHAELVEALYVSDLLGREILQQEITSAMTVVDVSPLTSGVYIVEVKMKNGEQVKRKLVVQ